MFKKLLAFVAAMFVAAAFAAVDVNTATTAELDSIKGIGPVKSALIMSERKKAPFKDWNDFVTRVKGVGTDSAAKFSAEGLTINGTSYKSTAKVDAKANAEVKADAKSEAKADAKADKKADKTVSEKAKDAAVATKDAVKGAAIATKDAVKETAKDVKAAVTPAKADAPKAAASAAKK